MTDKLRELVAQWEAEKESVPGPFANGCMWAYGQCARELKALLAEQAPAGELHPPKRKPINAECPLCQAKFIVFTLGPWRASDLAEPRDPAGK